MDLYPAEKVRNVALIGHTGTGKTTLAEALLYRAGLVARVGTVEEGTTVTDYQPEEKARSISTSIALAPIEWNGYKINIIDTPGMADFEGEVAAALSAVDLAVFVVSASDGVEPNTEHYWRLAAELGVPRMIFINKLDRENASFDEILAELRSTLGTGVAPIELPIGAGAGFHGVADLFRDTAYIYDSGHAEVVPIPEEMAQREHAVHDNLVEGIVVADDELLEAFLEGNTPSVEVLEETMKKGVTAAEVFPVVCGSATVPIGVDRLADFICEVGPSPADRLATVNAGQNSMEIPCDPNAEPLLFVFKTLVDKYLGQISLFKVLSGSVRRDDHLFNHRTGVDERLHSIFGLRGNQQIEQSVFTAGDIGAVAKLNDTQTSDSLSSKAQPVEVPTIPRPAPVLSIALTARSKLDEAKLSDALHRLVTEDPALSVEQNAATHQMLLQGMGETHLQIAVERLESKFGVSVDQGSVTVPYRETITRPAEAEGKHKKQSGGHGQFGVARILFEPLPEGGGFDYVDATKGGSIPKQYIPAVEKGIQEGMTSGGRYGFPVVDVKATCLEGKYHSVDSSELAFKMAGKLALREALNEAGPVILEPMSQITVRVPPEFQGDVMGDLVARRGRIQGTESDGERRQKISAVVPTSEITHYSIDLRSMTGGRGRHAAEHAHYEPLPENLISKVTSS